MADSSFSHNRGLIACVVGSVKNAHIDVKYRTVYSINSPMKLCFSVMSPNKRIGTIYRQMTNKVAKTRGRSESASRGRKSIY